MKKTAIALVALIALNAVASTQNLTISGTVSSQCAFSSAQNGTFGFDVQTPNILDTTIQGGTNASVSINYNGTPTVSINEITSFANTPVGFNGTVTFTNLFTSTNQGSITYTGGAATFNQSSGTADTLTLRLQAANASAPFPIGTYSASTVITCT